VLTNDSFIIQTETESNLIEPNRAEFASGCTHLTPLATIHKMNQNFNRFL